MPGVKKPVQVHPELNPYLIDASPSLKAANIRLTLARKDTSKIEIEKGSETHKRIGTLPNTIRLRGSGNIYYKFTPQEQNIISKLTDPLESQNILNSKTFEEWRKTARLNLPSTIGVPVGNAMDVVQTGLKAMDINRRKSLGTRDAYNNIFDEFMKQTLPDDSDPAQATTNMLERKNKEDSKAPKSLEESRALRKRKIVSLRTFPDHLTQRKKYKRKLVIEGLKESFVQGDLKSFVKEKFDRFAKKTHSNFHDTMDYLTFWKEDITDIEGRYGLGAGAYFKWLRTIIVLNIFYLIFSLSLVVIPEVAMNYASNISNTTLIRCNGTVPPEPNCRASKFPSKIPSDKEFLMEDLILGDGSLERSYLYYSGYKDTLADPFCPSLMNDKEHPDHVAQVTAFRFILVLMLICMMNSIYCAYQIVKLHLFSRIESTIPGLARKTHFSLVACAWNFSCSDKESARMLHRSIWREIKEMVGGIKLGSPQLSLPAENPFLLKKLTKRFGQQMADLIVSVISYAGDLLLCFVFGLMIHFSLYCRELWLQSRPDRCDPKLDVPGWLLVLPSVLISLTTVGISKFFSWVSTFENWRSIETRNLALMLRIGCYYVIVIAVLFGYWLTEGKQIKGDALCYEEFFGQDLFRLLMFQGTVHNLVAFVSDLVYHFYNAKKNPNYEKPEFDMARYSLNLFFLHTISGFGFFFCPFISLLVIVLLIILFYRHKYLLINLCRYPLHAVHMSEVAAPFITAFAVSHFVTTFLNVVLISELHPSSTCGPFSHFKATLPKRRAQYWQVFTEGADSTSGGLHFIFQPVVSYTIICFFFALCGIFRSWAHGFVNSISKLHELLILERKDRDFLLNAIYLVVKHIAELEEVSGQEKVETKVTAKATTSNDDSNKAETSDVGGAAKKSLESEKSTSEVVQGIFNSRRGSLGKSSEEIKSFKSETIIESNGRRISIDLTRVESHGE